MTLSTAKIDVVELRRERVAQLRLRGLSSREIAETLAKGNKDGVGKIVNPESGEPYSHTTIQNDLKALKISWQESYNIATDEHAARQLTEIAEIKRLAWSQKDGRLALSAIEKEMKLLGTMKQPDGLSINVTIVTQLVQAIERRGESASEWFEEMLQEMQIADRTGDKT